MSIFHRPFSAAPARATVLALVALPLIFSGLTWPVSPAQAQCITNTQTITTTITVPPGGCVINSGTVTVTGGIAEAIQFTGSGSLTNSGSVTANVDKNGGNGGIADTVIINGAGSVANSGSIVASANNNNGNTGGIADTVLIGGAGSVANSGSIIASANVNNTGTGGIADAVVIGGAGSVVNSGTISASANVTGPGGGSGLAEAVFITGNGTVVNSGTLIATAGGPSGLAEAVFISGSGSITNSGALIASANGIAEAIFFGAGNSTLTLLPGSFIIGSINFAGTNNTVSMNVGNQNLTFNTLAGVTVTGTVPFVAVGNRIASVDTTSFAVADKTLMAFTEAVWGLLGSRGNAAAVGAESGPLGFAADAPSYVEDAFSQVMGYAKAPSDALLFKSPTVTTADGTTVWAKGFYGQRTQQADGPNLRNVTQFYGGAIGLDRLVSPDLRLGGFAGGGSTSTAIDLNFGTARSDIGFGGVYGRKDIGTIFVDFGLLAGATSNRTTRNINNNLLATGLETATASFGGWFISPEVAAGKRYVLDSMWSLTPAVRFRYLASGFDSYTETGSTSNLSVASRTLQNIEERGDLTLTRTETFANADRLSTSIYAGLLGQQRVGDAGVNTILLGQALAFATPGKSSIGGAYAGGGVEWRTRNVTIFGSAEYTAMTDSSNTVTGRAGIRVGF